MNLEDVKGFEESFAYLTRSQKDGFEGERDSLGVPTFSFGGRGIKLETLKLYKVGMIEEKFRNENGGLQNY